tara:strand:- start:36322 stop:36912 length:591 start_codon:yes stop_codon:yes gene_type:complete
MQTIQATAAPGRAMTGKLYDLTGTTLLASIAGSEVVSSLYSFNFSGFLGTYRFFVIDDLTTISAASYLVDLTETSGVFIAADPPLKSHVSEAVWTTILSTLSATGNAAEKLIKAANGATGGGAIQFPIIVQDENCVPIAGVKCWISTDSAGSNIVTGVLITDDFGLVTFLLDVGTYYLWRDSSVKQFPNPTTIQVT